MQDEQGAVEEGKLQMLRGTLYLSCSVANS